MAGDVAAVRGWITERIGEASWLAEEARAAACDIEDQAVLDATIQLANDLEAFAARLSARLVEVGVAERQWGLGQISAVRRL